MVQIDRYIYLLSLSLVTLSASYQLLKSVVDEISMFYNKIKMSSRLSEADVRLTLNDVNLYYVVEETYFKPPNKSINTQQALCIYI